MKKRKAATNVFLEQQRMAKDDDMLVPEELSNEFSDEDEFNQVQAEGTFSEQDVDVLLQAPVEEPQQEQSARPEVLSQNEIDQLLTAISTGEVDAEEMRTSGNMLHDSLKDGYKISTKDGDKIISQDQMDFLLNQSAAGGLSEGIYRDAPKPIMDKQIFVPQSPIEPPVQQQMQSPAAAPKLFNISSPIKKEKRKKVKNELAISTIKSSEEMQLEKEPIKVRETGAWFWRRIIVPPNAYVVHTRINKKEPVTLGMGLSFRYNPNTDAYLVIPAAMQTIGVVANCISKEKQGINVLAYVQWQIDDFAVAYKKLDLSDSYDPLGIVNAQLREQAEAAIKDKIATMSVEEVLTDKEPVIEELTSRLKLVAEGQSQGNGSTSEGLGIKITTVQIREALVSSESLWNDLQSPFRHEQKKKSSISYLEMKNEIKKKELDTKRNIETEESRTTLEISKIKEKSKTETLELQLNEESVRYSKKQESELARLKMQEETELYQKKMKDRMVEEENSIKLNRELETFKQEDEKERIRVQMDYERQKKEKQLNIDQQLFILLEHARLGKERREMRKVELEETMALNELEGELNLMNQRHEDLLGEQRVKGEIERHVTKEKAKLSVEEEKNSIKHRQEQQRVEIEKGYQEIRNLINNSDLASQLIKELPKIASAMPDIHELKVLQTGAEGANLMDNFTSFLARALTIADTLGIKIPKTIDKE